MSTALAACAVLSLAACSGDSDASDKKSTSSASGVVSEEVSATVETEPVPHSGDAADDPAVWVDPADPSLSAIVATDKDGGLLVYDLAGRQLQNLQAGEMNNVDLRPAADEALSSRGPVSAEQAVSASATHTLSTAGGASGGVTRRSDLSRLSRLDMVSILAEPVSVWNAPGAVTSATNHMPAARRRHPSS